MASNNLGETRHKQHYNYHGSDQLEFDVENLLRHAEPASEARFCIDSAGNILSRTAEASDIFGLENDCPISIMDCPALDAAIAQEIAVTARMTIRSSNPSSHYMKMELKTANSSNADAYCLTLKRDPRSDQFCQCSMERISRNPSRAPSSSNQTQILENTGIAIWTIPNGSRYFEMVTPLDKLLECRALNKCDLDRWLEFVHPEDRSKFQEEFRQFIEGSSRSFHLRYRILTKTGKTKWISTIGCHRDNSGADAPDSIWGLHRDDNNIPNLLGELNLFSFLGKKVHSPTVITDADGRIAWFNAAFSDMSGYALHEMIGRKPGEVLQGPLSSQDVIRHMRERIHLKKAFHAEMVNYNKCGVPYWVRIDANPLVDKDGEVTHFIAFETNISERKKPQKKTVRNESMFRNLFDNALDAQLIVSQKDLLIVEANRASSRLFGDNQLIGESLEKIIARFPSLDLQRIYTALNSSTRFQASEELELGSEKCIPVDLSICQMPLGDTSALLVTLRDISDKRALESQLHHSQRMEAVGKLAGGVAHDFNNLLAGIRGFGELLSNSQHSSETDCNYIHEILKITDRASSLTSRLLSFSRDRSGKSKVTNLNQLIENFFPMLSRILKADIHCETELDSSSLNTMVDPAQIEQVIMNLFVNAQEASTHSDPKIVIRTRSAELSGDEVLINGTPPAGPYTVIEVEDNGQGIAPETIDKMFEPFFTTKHGAGTGLGLSIVYGIVDNSNGFLDVSSSSGQGTKFSIYFPSVFENSDAGSDNDNDHEKTSGLHYSDDASTILIAEDQTEVREILELGLGQSGYHLLIAKDGSEAVSIADDYDGEIDLLLTDAIMPKIHGAKLAGLIKKKRPHTKVVLMSGLPQCEAFDDQSDERLIDAYVDKPFSIIKLGALIKSILASRKSVV